jgi:outer membrane usher protein
MATAACVALLVSASAVTADGNGPAELLGVRINGIDQHSLVVARRLAPHALAVPVDALAAWQLRRPTNEALRFDGLDYIALETIAGLRWQVDEASQTLLIDVPPTAFTRHVFEHAAARHPAPTAASIGGYASYDLQWQRDSAIDGRAAAPLAGGLVELGAFGPWGHGRSGIFWRSGDERRSPRFTRLDSQWSIDLPTHPSSVQIGDAIGVPGAWGRSVRFGGVQWRTEFALQPGLVSFPMPAMRGEASVPSAVDLYVNDGLRLQGQVPAGAFDLTDVPAVTGQGQIRMVVRDLLGREQVIVQPYYVSPALLRPGLRDFALEAGNVRLDYGLESANYGRAFVAATERVGVSDTFTRELRAELLRGQQTLGVSGTWLLRQVATATASAALSRGPQGYGALVTGGIDHRGARWSASLEGRVASRSFVQLGQASAIGYAARSQLMANVATTLGQGSAGLSAVHQVSWRGERFAVVTLNYSRQFAGLGHVGVSLSHIAGAATGTSIGITFMRALGADASASVGHLDNRERREGGVTTQDSRTVVQLQGNAPAGPGWGYRLQADAGAGERLVGEATLNAETASLSAGVARQGGGSTSVRVGASGSLAWMPEGLFASRRIDGSFAVVEVGEYPGVRITRDSQVVGRTDDHGRALVTGLRGFERNRLGIEGADLPLDAQIDALQIEIVPGRDSGVSVRFPVQRARAATLRLVTADGTVVPPGSRVRVDGAARDFPVGFEGRLFLSDLADRNTIVAEWDRGRCVAQFSLRNAAGPVPELGEVACH